MSVVVVVSTDFCANGNSQLISPIYTNHAIVYALCSRIPKNQKTTRSSLLFLAEFRFVCHKYKYFTARGSTNANVRIDLCVNHYCGGTARKLEYR